MKTAIIGCLAFLSIIVLWLFFTVLGGAFWGLAFYLVATYLLPAFGYHITLEWWQWLLAGSVFQMIISAVRSTTTVKAEK